MQITDVRIRKVEKEGKMKAVVSITIDEEFVVHDAPERDETERLWYMILRSLRERRDYLSRCQAERQQTVNTVISHIRSIPIQETVFRN